MRPPGHYPAAELDHAHRDSAAVSRVVQTSKPELMARGVAFDLLQMAKRVGPQCKAAEYEDLSGEKSLTLDRIVVGDRRSHRA